MDKRTSVDATVLPWPRGGSTIAVVTRRTRRCRQVSGRPTIQPPVAFREEVGSKGLIEAQCLQRQQSKTKPMVCELEGDDDALARPRWARAGDGGLGGD